MAHFFVFLFLFQLGLINLTLGCGRAQLGEPDCTSCEENLDQFEVDLADVDGAPPELVSAPLTYQYSTRGDGCMIASMVCNPNAGPQQPSLSIISFNDVNTMADLSTGSAFTREGLGPLPTLKSEYRCQKGEWYSVQKANPAKKGLVAAILCITVPTPGK